MIIIGEIAYNESSEIYPEVRITVVRLKVSYSLSLSKMVSASFNVCILLAYITYDIFVLIVSKCFMSSEIGLKRSVDKICLPSLSNEEMKSST